MCSGLSLLIKLKYSYTYNNNNKQHDSLFKNIYFDSSQVNMSQVNHCLKFDFIEKLKLAYGWQDLQSCFMDKTMIE